MGSSFVSSFCLHLTPLSLSLTPYHLMLEQAYPPPSSPSTFLTPLLPGRHPQGVIRPNTARPVGPCLPSCPTTFAPNTTALVTRTATTDKQDARWAVAAAQARAAPTPRPRDAHDIEHN